MHTRHTHFLLAVAPSCKQGEPNQVVNCHTQGLCSPGVNCVCFKQTNPTSCVRRPHTPPVAATACIGTGGLPLFWPTVHYRCSPTPCIADTPAAAARCCPCAAPPAGALCRRAHAGGVRRAGSHLEWASDRGRAGCEPASQAARLLSQHGADMPQRCPAAVIGAG